MESNLSLGLVPSVSPASHRSQISDDSIFVREASSASSAASVHHLPLRLLESINENCHRGGLLHNQNGGAAVELNRDPGDEEDEREFRILGHSMCFKRRRPDSEIQCGPAKRPVVASESDLQERRSSVKAWGNQPISEADPELFEIMGKEKERQFKGIELIASENFVCRAVMDALGSHLTNKYSEGMPGARYYGGNQYIDEIENLCCKRALDAFGLDSENWGVNVQPYSCTSANFAVYTGLLLPGDRIMGLDTPSGERALDFRPKILICGGSSYPREWDYARFRQIADKCGAVLLCDMAQISGLVATKECVNPFDYCDIVTSTTHKSLRGPRGGIIFYRKGAKPRKRGMLLSQGNESEQYDFEEKINFAVFPSLQGGPHNNHIAALAIALKQVATPEYKVYMQQVKRNSQALANALLRRRCRLVTGGTDNHLLLWDLRPLGLTGKTYEKVCEMCHITVNKIAIFGDNGTITPGGVRIGTPAMTSRGCLESDFETMADFLLRVAHIASTLQREHGKSPKAFLEALQSSKDLAEVRNQVEGFATQFALPGFDV
ncbi:unnamed protein product [Linum trigynum]|uniref:Serine hydroxymethyltransferase n=1 Tax=Linum trigynum TaxID=586398 RepID=A0AAV2EIJ6_9ROSI